MGSRLLIAALALVGTAAPAQAAEVSASSETGYDSTGPSQITIARCTAAPGEVNDLSIRYEDRLVVFRDRVPLTAGAGCGAGADGAVAWFGGPGDDSLDGLSGLDRYAGGPGDDAMLLSGDPVGEPVDCGGGRDRTDWPGPALLLPNCELVERLRVYPRRGPAGRLTFTVGRWDRGRLELRVAGRARRFAVGRADGGRVRIRLPRRTLRLRRAPLLVEARFYVGGRRRTTWVFDLRRAQDLPR